MDRGLHLCLDRGRLALCVSRGRFVLSTRGRLVDERRHDGAARYRRPHHRYLATGQARRSASPPPIRAANTPAISSSA